MSNTANSGIWMKPPADGRRFAAAFAAGLLLELLALGILLPLMAHRSPPPETPSLVKLSIIAPAPAPKPPVQPPPPKPLPPPPKPLPPPPPLPVAPPIPLPPPPPRPTPSHIVRHRPPPPKPVVPPVQPPPPPVQQAPPPPSPPPAPVPSASEQDIFRAAMRQAVQDAARVPDAAAMAREFGVTRVSFVFTDGAVSNIVVVASSGFPLLDQAAMQAVREARYPTPPSDFKGRSESVTVDVIFRAETTDVNAD